MQLHLPRFAVQQRDAPQGELFSAEIQVGKANVAVDDPGRLMSGGQYAEFARRARGVGPLAAKRTGAASDVA
ncbi:hypothetical protein D3C80_1803310 [compost metagenome]